MAIYTSNTNRVTGLASGLDIDNMVDQLMQAESTKYNNLEKQQTWITWQQEAYREIIQALQDFESKWFTTTSTSNNIGYNAFWNQYETTATDVNGNAVSGITVKSATATGSYTIEVNQVATAESISSFKAVDTRVTTTASVDDITKAIEDSGEISFNIELNGKSKTITITAEELKNGITGITDENDNPITGFEEVLEYKINEAFGNQIKVERNGENISFSTSAENILKFSEATSGSSDLSKLGLTSETASVNANSKLIDVLDGYASLFDSNNTSVTRDDDDAITLNFGGKDITIREDMTIQDLINEVKASGAGVELSFNQVTGRFKLTATETGVDNGINITDGNTLAFLNECLYIDIKGSQDAAKKSEDQLDDLDRARLTGYTPAQDAVIILDGITVTRSSNDIEMNGLSLSITSAALNKGPVTVETQSDTDAIFNKLKEFVEDYNNLVEKLQNAVTESRARDSEYGYYEPLSTAEREAMTDEEIEKWEKQAKTGLLYNDSTITSMLSKLRNLAYVSIDVGGSTISLYEIGISHTSDYNSQKLEIDEDKLKKAIQERGDEIAAMFTQSKTGIADQIKTILNDAVGTNGTLREKAGIANTASVNNNELSKQLKEIAERLSAEKTRLQKKETYYYNMFSAMETAMTAANSQLSVITSLLGY